MFRLTGHCLAFIVTTAVFGCGESTDPPLAPTRGSVVYRGKPLAEATVAFVPTGGPSAGKASFTVSDAEGKFRMTYRNPGDGTPVGSYRVTVTQLEKRKEGDEEIRNGRNLLPAKYADPATSGFTAEIKPGDNELPPFVLE